MITSVDKEFTRLEEQLDLLMQMVKPLSHEQQNFKPSANAWSILQVFRHMMQSEGQINQYLRKKILGAEASKKAGMIAKFRSVILNAAMRLPLKYKVPPAIQVELEDSYDYEKLSTEWKLLRKQIRDFLNSLDERTAQKEIFRHPVVGRMSIIQGLGFMQEHLVRHTQQVARIIRNADFPKT
jgi:uncharacterized damage-inducible protein DinB